MRKIFLLLFIVNFSINSIWGNIIEKNSLKDIQSAGVPDIVLVRVYGSEDSSQEYDFFKNPSDVAVDRAGNVYIIDAMLHLIRKYNSKGVLLKNLCSKGKGPGDVIAPVEIKNLKNKLVIREYGNMRIQVLGLDGKYISSHRSLLGRGLWEAISGDSFLYSHYLMPGGKEKCLGIIKDSEGKSLVKIGAGMKLPPIKKKKGFDDRDSICSVAYDGEKGFFYFAYSRSQMLQKFDHSGKLLSTISYDTELNKVNHIWDKKKSNFVFSSFPEKFAYSKSLAVDEKGNVWLVTSKRAENKKEGSLIRRTPQDLMQIPTHKDYPDQTDLHWLLVFNSKGEVIGKKQLSFFCSKIRIYGGSIFFIDKIFDKVVYQFKIAG